MAKNQHFAQSNRFHLYNYYNYRVNSLIFLRQWAIFSPFGSIKISSISGAFISNIVSKYKQPAIQIEIKVLIELLVKGKRTLKEMQATPIESTAPIKGLIIICFILGVYLQYLIKNAKLIIVIKR